MTAPLIETALKRYGLGGARLNQLSQGFVMSFHVVSSRGEFCLKMYDLPSEVIPPPGRPSLKQLHAQLGWLSALAREIPLLVPEPVPGVEGSLTRYVPSEGSLEPRSAGSALRVAALGGRNTQER